MADCIQCEVNPVTTFNGEKVCAVHAEQRADFAAREAPPIAYSRHVDMHPQRGTSSSGTPRHYK
jgi:hypothetical protein